MRSANIRKLTVAAVSAFMVISCVALYASLSSGSAPLRGELPSVGSGMRSVLEIVPGDVPLGELPGFLEDTEAESDEYAVYEDQARNILDTMTEDEKLYQLFFVTPEQLTGYNWVYQAGTNTAKSLERLPVGGLIYFSKNLVDTGQTTEMLSKTQEFSKIPLFLGVDEEGGRVARVSGNPQMGFDEIPSMSEIGASGDTRHAREVGAAIGGMLSSLGFNMDFAPVADVLLDPDNTEIGDRSFGSDPTLVADMTAAVTEGLRSAGIASCLKHFPGHGNASGDSHDGYSESARTLDEMRAAELRPFKAGIRAGCDFILMSHITAVSVDDSAPASLSGLITTRLLREELGYERLIITDSLSMGAITGAYGSGEAAVLAIEAGADMLLMPDKLSDAVQGLRTALDEGRITWARIDESVTRILTVKLERGIIPADYLETGETD